jgi:hypothetical protein
MFVLNFNTIHLFGFLILHESITSNEKFSIHPYVHIYQANNHCKYQVLKEESQTTFIT